MLGKKNIKMKVLEFRRSPTEAPIKVSLDQAISFGNQAKAGGHYSLAEYHFRQIANAFPKEVNVRLKLLELAVLSGDGETFDQLILQLQKLKVKRGDLLPMLIERALGEFNRESAQQLATEFVALKPNSVHSHYHMGQVHRSLGDSKRAVSAYDWVISHHPEHPEPYYNRALLLKQEINVRQKEQLDSALVRVRESEVIPFAYLNLAKAWSHFGDVDEEFRYLDKAKHRLAAQTNIKQEAFWEEFLSVANFCTKEKLKAAETIHITDEAPVFIVAMGRSGTTLLESILNAHRDFVATGERGFLTTAADQVGLSIGQRGSFWEWGNSFKLEDLLSNFHRIISSQSAIKATAGKRWLNKSLQNFYNVGLAKMIYPRAKFIYIKRNPMAVCLSNYQHFMALSNSPCTLEQLAHYYQTIERAVEYWQALLGDDIKIVEYEQLTRNFEGELRDLLSFLNVEWDEACLRFNEQSSVVLTPSTSAVRANVNRSAENRWMLYEKHLQPVAKVLNL